MMPGRCHLIGTHIIRRSIAMCDDTPSQLPGVTIIYSMILTR